MALYHPVGDAIGIEIEASRVSKQLAIDAFAMAGLPGKVVGDGSVRHHHSIWSGVFHNIDMSPELMKLYGLKKDSAEFGAEVVSPIIDTTVKGWESWPIKVLEILSSLGEEVATTTSIHIHVNAAGLPVDCLQNLVKIWQCVESGIFRLSCGPLGVHRGALHRDYHFCRPYTDDGPLFIRIDDQDTGSGYSQCFKVDALQDALTLNEFAQTMGRCDLYGGTHYHTPRYMALGIHSLFRLGSIELRTPNYTPYGSHILAWAALAKALVRSAMDKEVPPHLLEERHPLGSDEITLRHVISTLRIRDPGIIGTLHELWDMGTFPPPIKGPRMTHLEQRISFSGVRKVLRPRLYKRLPKRVHDKDSFANPEENQVPDEQFVDLEVVNYALERSLKRRRRY